MIYGFSTEIMIVINYKFRKYVGCYGKVRNINRYERSLNADYMGCMGNEIVKTPNMDRLAQKGMLFTNTYTSCPLCVPARMSFMTGVVPSRLEVYHNEESMRSDQATFAHCAGAEGYETSLIGRMHFVGEDQRHGFENRFADDFNRIWGRGGLKREDLGEYVLTPAGDITKLIGGGTSPVLEYDRQVVTSALDYFSKDYERPQLAVVGLFGPHHPFVAPPELYKYYRELVDFPKDYGKERNYTHPIIDKHFVDIDEKTMLDIRAAYYGMITQVDNQLGEVYDKWQEYLQRNNRKGVFIYLSDHGEMAGENGLYRKETFFEGSCRIPLIVCGEGISQGVVTTPTSIMDISDTICEIINSDRLPDIDGKSLLHHLEGQSQTKDNERAVFCEYVYRDIPGIMVRKGDYKLISYYGYESDDLLFNISNDPFEFKNIVKENTELYQSLKSEIPSFWSGAQILNNCEKWNKQHQILAKWGANSHTVERDLWIIPDEARKIPMIR